MNTQLVLLRHGETDWNTQHRIQGQTDTALNHRGMEQARALVDARGLEVTALPQLRERHLGIFQGYTGAEAQARWPEEYARHKQRDVEQTLGNGESLRQLQQRVIAACEALIARHTGQHIALLTHAGVIDIVYRHVLGRTLDSARDFTVGNGSVHRLKCDAECWHLLPETPLSADSGLSAVE